MTTMRDMMTDETQKLRDAIEDVVLDEDDPEIGAIQQIYGIDRYAAEERVYGQLQIEAYEKIVDEYESKYKSKNGEDVYDREIVDHVDWQEVEANHSSLSQRDSKDTQEHVHVLGDPEEDIGKRTKPPFDYINPQRLSDLMTLGFSDVQIAQTLSVSPESVERARSLYSSGVSSKPRYL